MTTWTQKLRIAGATLALAPALAAAPALAEESAQPITVSVSLGTRTTSTSTRLTGWASIPLPECPSGLRFLVRELQASHRTPAPDYYGMRASCKTWEVFVPTQQNYATRQYPSPERLAVVGQGWAHAATSLAAGVDLSDLQVQQDQLTLWVECDAIVSGTSPSGFKPTFQAHLGGYCGKPSSLGTVYTVP